MARSPACPRPFKAKSFRITFTNAAESSGRTTVKATGCDFYYTNRRDPDGGPMLRRVAKLKRGATITMGGGAAPLVRIKRLR